MKSQLAQIEDRPTSFEGGGSDEAEHDGEGFSVKDITKVVNQVAKHPVNKLVNQVIDVIKHPADISKLVNQVTDVIKHSDDRPHIADIFHRVVPVGSGLSDDQDGNEENVAYMENAEIEDHGIEGEMAHNEKWYESNAKVPKLEDSPCFGDFQQSDDHTPSRIPSTDKRKYAQRICAACRRNGIRRDTCYYCKECMNSPALCKDCFRDYHM